MVTSAVLQRLLPWLMGNEARRSELFFSRFAAVPQIGPSSLLV